MQVTEFDREWAENAAGRQLSIEEVIEFKRDYEDWVNFVEENMENNPLNYAE
jgi:hypothetical protein